MDCSIRVAELNDLPEIVDVHFECFKNNFSSSLGKKILSNYYKEYLLESPELFLILEKEEKVKGFVMGYYSGTSRARKKFEKKNKLKLIIKFMMNLIKLDKRALKKITALIKNKIMVDKFNKLEIKQEANLLSICVLEELRGKGASNLLIKRFEEALLKKSKKVYALSTTKDNVGAIAFYKKNKFEVIKTTELGIYFIKDLKK